MLGFAAWAQQEGQRMEFVSRNLEVFIAAAGVLAGLIIAMIVFGAFSRRMRGRRGQRLGISEYHELDQTRRLVLIRRDETEHLILIGGVQDIVIETGIGIPAQETHAPVAVPAEFREPMMRPPRPPVFGDRRPPQTAEREPPPFIAVTRES